MWGREFCAVELIRGRHISLRELGFLILRFAKILHDLGPKVLINLGNLQLGLADFGFGGGNCGD